MWILVDHVRLARISIGYEPAGAKCRTSLYPLHQETDLSRAIPHSVLVHLLLVARLAQRCCIHALLKEPVLSQKLSIILTRGLSGYR